MLRLFIYVNFPFIIFIMLVMILSGVVSFLLPRFFSYLVIIVSGVAGYALAIYAGFKELAVSTSITSVVFSLIVIGLIKYSLYLGKKADELEEVE